MSVFVGFLRFSVLGASAQGDPPCKDAKLQICEKVGWFFDSESVSSLDGYD